MAVPSAADLKQVASATSKLQELLAKAQNVKAEGTIEPPLPTAPFIRDVKAIHPDLNEPYDQNYQFSVIETAAREIFYQLVGSTNIEDTTFVDVWNLLDIILICSDQGQCTPELVCYLIEELLDSQTTNGCRVVFDYLESRRERLVQKDFHKKNLVFLRTCNELLRRLSRAEDAIFCGRVFFFLFQTFPLGDKSSVNLRGEFHVENTTKFEVSEEESVQDGEKMEVDSDPVKADGEAEKASTPQPPSKPGSKAVPIKEPPKKEEEPVLSNSDLYPIFWRLQQDFCEPTRLFLPENLKRFKKGLAYTITKFKNTPTVVETATGDDSKRGTKRKLGYENEANGELESSEEQFLDQYNPKYLTSRDLFDLELSDQAFQRHVLLQSTILIDFLLSLTEKAKKRIATLETPNKSMLYSFTLSEEDLKWGVATRQAISTYLCTTSDGKLFNRIVDTVLARDKNWTRWKIESCPSIVRGPFSTESELEARKGSKKATRFRRPGDGSEPRMDLAFLVEDSQTCLETLENPARYGVTPIDTILSEIERDQLDLEFEEEGSEAYAYFRNLIASKRWRVIRQTTAANLGVLDKVEPGKDLAAVFRPPTDPTPEPEAEVEAEPEPEVDAEPPVEDVSQADAAVNESKLEGNGAEDGMEDTAGNESKDQEREEQQPEEQQSANAGDVDGEQANVDGNGIVDEDPAAT